MGVVTILVLALGIGFLLKNVKVGLIIGLVLGLLAGSLTTRK
jgi:hypothetical protein